MNKKLLISLFLVLSININSAFAQNLSSRLMRLHKLQDDANTYLKLAKQSNLEIIEDRVLVTVLANQGITTANIDENNLTAFGARIRAKSKHTMSVEIPISSLEDVSNALTGLAQITPPIRPEEHAVTSEGVALMNGDYWQTEGYTGSGVKVAVIDGGFMYLTAAQGEGDIPSSYSSHDFTGGGLQTTTQHGTAVAEAIYDLVPDAQFYFYKIANLTQFENAIDSCISNDVDIVNHSMGWFNAGGYYDGTGFACQFASEAIDSGIVWVNSAGNSALDHYRETFSGNPSGFHIFNGPNDTINQTGPYSNGETVRIVMNWDAYPNQPEDYDLYLMRDNGSAWVLVDSSVTRQNGSAYPQESIMFSNTVDAAMYGILVKEYSTSSDADFTIFNLDKSLSYYSSSSSLTDPGTVTEVITVGAIDRTDYTSGPQEPFSSQGPTTDGRTKPDVAAPDNCICYAYSGYWYGTSLSSPHTAGVCALIKSRFTGYSNSEIRSYLYNDCTVDLGTAGKDNIYGYGKVVMPDISITVTAPNGSEEWQVGTSEDITWTSSGTTGGVHIEYSTNNGSSWSDVIASTTDDGTHPWTIPNAPSVNCLVRISDTVGSGSPADTSDAVFTIYSDPDITVTDPNGGEDWLVGSSHNITWTSVGTSGNVHIEYSTNNGSNWSDVIASTTDDEIHPWTIPNAPSVNCLVRISDTDGDPSDTCDAVFTISITPSLTITAPVGGENWYIDSTYNITWNSVTSGGVELQYSTDSGATWTDIISSMPDTSVYPWVVPNAPSDSCLVRVADTNGNIADTSDSMFEISHTPYVDITLPIGGETWYVDSIYNITWNSVTSGGVELQYSTDSGATWTDIISSMPDTSVYPWVVPNAPSDSCLVRVADTNGNIADTSDSMFEISHTPYVDITLPIGGETWYVDSIYNITWNSVTSGGVELQYSTNSGATWTDITLSMPDTGAYPWTIPNAPSDSCLVRVADTNGTLADTSDSIFAISAAPYITITAPNGGENWYLDSTYNITWYSISSGGVDIEYSSDSGETWLNIIQNMEDTNNYAWTIPSITPSVNCFVRISDTISTSPPVDTSDAIFTITDVIAVPFAKIPAIYSMNTGTVTTGNNLEINYALPKKSIVTFEVFDIKGTKIKEYSEDNIAGFHSKTIDISKNPSGIYFVKMDVKEANFNKRIKVIVVK